MKPPSLETLDLNLLVTLDALLAERSVSRAALRLSLTQPAVSRALARLRDAFADELLVRTGQGMRPTRLALELAGPLRRVLSDVEGLLAARGEFVPSAADRRFRVAAVDYAEVMLLAPLARRLEARAPRVDLIVRPLTLDAERELEAGELDLMIVPRAPAGSGVVWTPLFDDGYTGIVWNEQRLGRLTLQRFAALDHVLVSPWGRPGGVVDDVLAQKGLVRRVAVQVPSFLGLPHVLVGSRRIATVPIRMAERLCELYPLRVVELPIAVPRFTLCMAWHEVHRHDPGHAWLRAELADVSGARRRPARR